MNFKNNKDDFMSLDVRLVQKVWETEDFETFTNREDEYYTANITHNLGEMADACGLYEVLWRPYLLFRKDFENYDEEMEYEDSLTIKARQLIEIMEKGLRELKSHPEKYKAYDSPNGWGLYENFVPFVEKYLKACKKYPDLLVQVDR
jgi:hypothetical protein